MPPNCASTISSAASAARWFRNTTRTAPAAGRARRPCACEPRSAACEGWRTDMPATYLLRFDDLCPTMNWAVWQQIETALIEANVRPILAVVPDNKDPELSVGPERERFWES